MRTHGNTGKIFTKEHRRKLSESHKGLVSNNKGKITSNSYMAVHHWSNRYIVREDHCQKCGKGNCRLEIANIDHQYKRVKEDWITLCVSCHRKHDIKNHGYRGWA